MLRRHTHRDSKEQGLYTCTPAASIFVLFLFFLKVHHPPLESYESHAGGAALKVCHRGEAPGPGLESPIATQNPRQRTSPGTAAQRKESKCPPETHCPSTCCFTQIPFHSQMCVAFSGQPANSLLTNFSLEKPRISCFHLCNNAFFRQTNWV